MNIALVYPHGNSLRTPDAIGFHLARELAERGHRVRTYNLRSFESSDVPLDRSEWILLGHPTWRLEDTFYQLWSLGDWKQVSALCPFCPGDPRTYGYLGIVSKYVDTFSAITGEYWRDQCSATVFAPLADFFDHIDLAVNTESYPTVDQEDVKTRDSRKWLYVGNHAHFKNLGYLNRLAKQLPEIEFHRIGPVKRKYRSLIQHGPSDLLSDEFLKIATSCRFLITPGIADANPTVILEAMALGLIPVAPPGSGYYPSSGVLPIFGDSLSRDLQLIRDYAALDGETVMELISNNNKMLASRFNWVRFTDDILRSLSSRSHLGFVSSSRYWPYFFRNKLSPFRFERFIQHCAKKSRGANR